MSLSKTAAIKAARSYVGHPVGRATSWSVTGPYACADYSGPSTTINVNSYPKAVGVRTRWVAEVALALMDRLDLCATVDYLLYRNAGMGGYTVDALVSAAIAEGPMNASEEE